MTEDYAGYERKPSGDAMERLTELAEELNRRDEVVREATEALKLAKEEQRQISEEAIPEIMDEVGMEQFTTSSGLKLDVKETVRASIPKDSKGPALRWLRDNGHAGIIDRKVSMKFGVGEDERADEIVGILKVVHNLQVSDDAGVHHSRLGSFVRELLEEGKPLPEDLLGVFRQRKARIAS